MSDGHATADLELSTSDTAVPSREDKTHVPEASAATLVQNGSTKGGDQATGQSFVVESPTPDRNGRNAQPAESQTLIAPADGSPADTDGAYRFGATVVAGGANGQDYSLGATLVGDSVGVANGDAFQMGATVAGGDDPAARATRMADVVNSLDPSGPADEHELQPGESLIGRFRVLKILGEGSFGAVYLAEDPQLDRRVAIKVTKVGVLTTRSDVDRFQREAKAAAQLRHPNIVPVYEVGRIGRSSFLAYEFIDGRTLGNLIKERKKLSSRDAAQVMFAISGALGYAHELGIIHRDMKPDNVLVDKQGQPHIADFGLARRDSGEMDKTREGGLMGTPLYMSPEQASGRSHEADARADVWSLGVMLREMLTGVLPFTGKLTEILIAIQTVEPPSIRALDATLPKDLETICQKCLSKDPAQRYANGTELAAELDRFLRGEPILARPLSMPARLVRWVKRNPKEASLVAGIFTLLFAGFFVSSYFAYKVREKSKENALSQLETLRTVIPGGVQATLDSLKPVRDDVSNQLDRDVADERLGSVARNRLLLAKSTLFPDASGQDERLAEAARTLVKLPADELAMQVTLLIPHRERVIQTLRQIADEKQNPIASRMALYALTKLADGRLSTADVANAASGLLPMNPRDLTAILGLIEPIRGRIGIELEKAFGGSQTGVQAANVLAEIYRNEPEKLFALAHRATPQQLQPLITAMSSHEVEIAKLARNELSQGEVGETIPADQIRSMTNAFLVLYAVAPRSVEWGVLAGGADNTLRTEIIHALPEATPQVQPLAEQLRVETNPLVRQALLLILAKVPPTNLLAEDRMQLQKYVVTLSDADPSPAVHSGARWYLQQTGGESEASQRAAAPALPASGNGRSWLRNSQGQEFAIVKGPVEFLMGAPPDDVEQDKDGFERQHLRMIPRSFAIGMQEVTVRDYLRCDEQHDYNQDVCPAPECPMTDLSWIDAAKYCRWLSEQEGVPEDQMCFPPVNQITRDMQLPADVLDRTGYRLPTAAEWEYACRAGSRTSRWIGSGDRTALCAWYEDTCTHPVGILEPNGLGLFDTLGNAFEYCQDFYFETYPVAPEGQPVIDGTDRRDGFERELRGACYAFPLKDVRCSLRDVLEPDFATQQAGFRLARTIRE